MNDATSQSTDGLKPITVRISNEAYDTISTLADEYSVKKADIIRMALDSSLDKYLGKLQYIDPEQAKVINQNIITVGNVLVDVRDQVRRIGVNYNREVKLKNIERKMRALEEREQQAIKNGISTSVLKKILDEKDAVINEQEKIITGEKYLDREEIEELISRMEDVVAKAGEVLCMVR